ncbi:MAG: antA/AntB antirepressor family protein [Candidatus Marinimicrobia bacterium]|nr:antA/AntB antirepressor family protein [Candidatus Neomarinimicrobiota bacterium]
MSKSKNNVISINQLIPINSQEIDSEKVQTVNARDVWKFLEVKTEFADWIQRNIKRYDFIEGIDYVCSSDLTNKQGRGKHKIQEYYVSLDMAKELTMVQNNPKGREARQYFIQCEKMLKKILLRQARIDWKTAKNKSILPQIQKTDTIKVFVEYAKIQGSRNAETYYMNIQKMEYDALFNGGYKHLKLLSLAFPDLKVLKDLLNDKQLFTIINADIIVEKALQEGMDKNLSYKDIFKLAKERVLTFADFVGKSSILFDGMQRKSLMLANN